ncbi:MAG TPA: 2-oxoglutarate oxidoreductase, partial [Bacteroidales bacterium]|nr:2-oxoglutarate oxidoreductase [Bacteroidales bacterium]
MTDLELYKKELLAQGAEKIFTKTKNLTDTPFSYCGGCGHGVAHRLIMEAIEELDITHQTIGVAPVGCSVIAYDFMNIDV